MSSRPFLGLMALGPVDPEILRRLRSAIAKILLLPVRILRSQPLPQQTYHVVRRQYNSTQLLEYLMDAEERGAFRILGITAVDLYIPILTFVFGEAQLDGRAAVISLYRPRGDDGSPAPPRPVFWRRLIKLSLHELGHSFGLEHCRREGCLMGFSSNLEQLDRKNLAFCDYCRVLLTDYLRDRGLDHRFRRYEGTPAPDAANPIADIGLRRRH